MRKAGAVDSGLAGAGEGAVPTTSGADPKAGRAVAGFPVGHGKSPGVTRLEAAGLGKPGWGAGWRCIFGLLWLVLEAAAKIRAAVSHSGSAAGHWIAMVAIVWLPESFAGEGIVASCDPASQPGRLPRLQLCTAWPLQIAGQSSIFIWLWPLSTGAFDLLP